ncbi:CBS domain-containing protein [Sphingomicrobium flavum]|uniref:CBS domain-containing protein n=1 Tax=Sphingomicrobium flavum TaxID=1229164 RepID=UPI0021ADDC80|nr:CBS domain-containing protein [Sphingomicrobium flavum]
MQIDQLMTKDIKTVSPTDSVQQAASFMLNADTGSIPVCEGDKLVGMITDRDIAVRGVASGKGGDCPVSELMTQNVECARDTDDSLAVAQMMADKQVRRMPVLNQSDQLVGMVSLGDLARQTSGAAADTALEGVSAQGSLHQQG